MLTGVVLARNEERNIDACLRHLRPHVSELLLIDMESTDETVNLAKPYVDRVLRHPHIANFDAARNIAIPEAINNWLWFVDADEQIPELTGKIVNQLIRETGDQFDAINIPFKSYFCGHWMQHCGWWPGYTCPRVLKRGHFEFSRTLHGGVNLNGREIRLPPDAKTGIEHYSFRDLYHYIEKFNRYTSTEALQLAERGIAYDWREAVRFMAHDLWEHYEWHNAKLDGELGWVLTWMAGQYRWLSVTKLIDHGKSAEKSAGPSSVPKDLDEFVRALEEEIASFRTRRPEFPLGIVLRAPIWDAVTNSHDLVKSIVRLASGKRNVVLESLSSIGDAVIPEDVRSLLRALERCRRARHVITITEWGSVHVAPDRCACHNVLRLPAGARVPSELLSYLNAYDEIWVGELLDLQPLVELGAAPERLRVVESLARKRCRWRLG